MTRTLLTSSVTSKQSLFEGIHLLSPASQPHTNQPEATPHPPYQVLVSSLHRAAPPNLMLHLPWAGFGLILQPFEDLIGDRKEK